MLKKLPVNRDPNLLVGYETSDDAGVYRLTDEMAIITTADFITPPVNDPYVFGQIAAANALSDVYAMGGRPITCLNLAGFPSKKLGLDVLNRIVAGGLSKITEAGAVLAGGHTTEDEEPKYGLAVTGIVHPQRFWSNAGARPGDVLLLTKSLGSGVLFNANLKGWVSVAALAECLTVITQLNRTAAEIMQGFEIHAATDITGFGLSGHAFEMARGSQVQLRLSIGALPIMREALEMYERGMSTGVNLHNRRLVENHIRFENELPSWHREIVYDPQTSGGLMVAVPEHKGWELVTTLLQAGVAPAAVIGRVDRLEDDTYLVFT
jgi:selenide,water dikinase